MITIEGSVHHHGGDKTSFLINGEDGSWTQWGGATGQLGESRDYVDAMAKGLNEYTDYFQQEDTVEPPAEDGLTLYPFPEPENPTPDEAARYAVAAMYAAEDGRSLTEGCTKSEVNGYLMRANETLAAADATTEEAAAEPLLNLPTPGPDVNPTRRALHALACMYAERDGMNYETGCTRGQAAHYDQLAGEALSTLIPGS